VLPGKIQSKRYGKRGMEEINSGRKRDMRKRNICFFRNDTLTGGETLKNRTVLFIFTGLSGLLLFGYFSWFGEGHFFVQEQKILFIYSGEYFLSFASKPGGVLEFAGAFLTQGYRSALYGALLLTSVFILFSVSCVKVAKLLIRGDKSVPPILALVPSFLLLLILVREDHYLYQFLGYLLMVVCFHVAVKSIEKGLFGIIPGSFPFLYYLTGSFSFLFVMMIMTYSLSFLKRRQKFIHPLLLVVSVTCTFFIFREIIFLQPTKVLLSYPLVYFKFPDILPAGYMVVFPFFIKAGMNLKREGKSTDGLALASLVLLFISVVFYLRLQYDPERRKELILEKVYIGQKWNDVIRIHEKYRSKNAAGQYFFNLALVEKDELCEKLFTCRQDYHGKSLTLPRTKENLSKVFYFYYAIGLINEAYHLAYESMVIHGYQAENLKMLVKTDLINGNHIIAERHINLLKKTLFYRKWAFRYEKMLYKPGAVLSDTELGTKTMLQPRFDFFVSTDDRNNLDMMLIANPDNTRAFECRMAWLLLDKEYKNVVYHVKQMKEMRYRRIPHHIEEALIIFENQKYEMPYLGGFKVSGATRNRYQSYLSDRRKTGAEDSKRAMLKMGPRWKDTLWYYFDYQ
jgi:hypothetical protein